MRVAIVTASFASFDPVRPLPKNHGFDDAVCVSDNLVEFGSGWRSHVVKTSESPRLAAKRPKMMPWLYTDCDAAIWVDASFELTDSFGEWAREHLTRHDFVVWQHPEGRNDFLDEAAVCWDWPKYRGSDLRSQTKRYLEAGMPRGWGLFACGVVGYRFTSEVKRLGSLWHLEQERSVQDQVSLPFLLWREGLPFGIWQANEYSNPHAIIRWDERPDNTI